MIAVKKQEKEDNFYIDCTLTQIKPKSEMILFPSISKEDSYSQNEKEDPLDKQDFSEILLTKNELPVKEDAENENPLEGDGDTYCESVFSTYMKEILSIPVCTKQEEQDLLIRIKKGDKEAFNELITRNQKLVVHVAKTYANHSHSMDMMDLVQHGNIGLMKAIHLYDLKYETKLSTYATYWIRQSIGRALEETGNQIRVPNYVNFSFAKAVRLAREESYTNGRDETWEDVKKYLNESNLSKDTIKKLELVYENRNPLSLEKEYWGTDKDEGVTIMERLVDQDEDFDPVANALKLERKEQIHKALSVLTENERTVISLRFGLNGQDPLTLDQIGKIRGVTRERIRQIESKAIKKLYQRKGKELKPLLLGM